MAGSPTPFRRLGGCHTIVTYLPMKLVRELGFTEMEAGFILAAQAVSTAIIAYEIENIKEKVSDVIVLVVGFLLTSFAVFSLSWSSSIWLIVLFLVVFGAGMGLVDPVINDLVTTLAPDETVGGVTSIYNTMKYVGQTAAPVTLGALLIYYPRNIAFIFLGTIGMVATLSALTYTKIKK